ncbi:MAG: AP endonuclease, partial [Balneolaceae bacterium]
KTLLDSGFTGNIGIIGHTEGEDVRDVLLRNLSGLHEILGELEK